MTTASLRIYRDTQDPGNPGYAYSFVVTDPDSDDRHEETGEVEGDDLDDATTAFLDATLDGETWREVLAGADYTDTPDGARTWRW
jgi:hypothetical protein